MQSFSLKIADWQIAVHADFDKPHLNLPKAYQAFLIPFFQDPDWVVDVQYGKLPSVESLPCIHDTKESWALFQEDKYFWYVRPSPSSGKAWGLLRLEAGTTHATLFSRQVNKTTSQAIPLFVHPLDQLLFYYWVSFYPALIIHACGVGVDDFGYAFLGHSGWGKSTLARLFQKHSNHFLLSDDRLIVSQQEKKWRVFGTPWHGDAEVYSPASFPLKKLLFLKHGEENQLTPIHPSQAAAKIFAMSFPVLWDKAKTNHALEMASQIATVVPCYEFSFLPDASAVDFLAKNLR